MRIISNSIVFITAFCFAGCGSSTSGQEGDSISGEAPPQLSDATSAGATMKTRLMNKVELPSGVFEFHEISFPDGTSVVAREETTSAFSAKSATDMLLEQEGMLTQLETFIALGGSEDSADPLLVASHAEEAYALERADLSVHRPEFDPRRPIEKSATACENKMLLPLPNCGVWQNVGKKINTSGDQFVCMGSSGVCRSSTTLKVQGICNDGSSGMTYKVGWSFGGGSWSWSSQPLNVGAGQEKRWINTSTAPTWIAMQGFGGSNYHLFTGHANAIPRCN